MLSTTLLTAVAASSALSWQVQAAPHAPAKRATVCNGDASLCDRLYSNVTYIGTHDSYAISSSSIAANQDVSIAQQLASGVRLLQSQAHKSPNATSGSGIDLCHTSCSILNGGSLETWLSSVKTFVDANPTEVITLLIVNSDSLPASTFAQAYQSTGLDQKSWAPSGGQSAMARDAWPTLGSLVESGKTVVSFLASEADTSSVPYLLPEFGNVWENPYDQVNYPFNCSIDRMEGSAPSDQMYLVNNFRDIQAFGSSTLIYPDKGNLSTTNSMSGIMQGADTCASTVAGAGGRYPTFVLLDFFNTPAQQPFQAAAAMNGIKYVAPASSGSGSGSGSSGSAPSTGSNGVGNHSGARTMVVQSAGALAAALLCAAVLL